MINVNLTRNDHIEELVKKASQEHYFLVQLKRSQAPPDDLVAYYCSCIRSSLDYACPVFHYALRQYKESPLVYLPWSFLQGRFKFPRYIDCMRVHQEQITK